MHYDLRNVTGKQVPDQQIGTTNSWPNVAKDNGLH